MICALCCFRSEVENNGGIMRECKNQSAVLAGFVESLRRVLVFAHIQVPGRGVLTDSHKVVTPEMRLSFSNSDHRPSFAPPPTLRSTATALPSSTLLHWWRSSSPFSRNNHLLRPLHTCTHSLTQLTPTDSLLFLDSDFWFSTRTPALQILKILVTNA